MEYIRKRVCTCPPKISPILPVKMTVMHAAHEILGIRLKGSCIGIYGGVGSETMADFLDARPAQSCWDNLDAPENT